MTTYTELLPETKSEKHGAYTWEATADDNTPRAGILTITGKRSHTVYAVDEFPADEGRGFMLLKQTPGTDKTEDHYAVFAGAGGERCECRGFAAHHRCKHLTSILDLLKAGQL